MSQERDNIMKSQENQKKYKYMRAALKEAQKAFDKNEVPVGAVVVYQDKIIARAHNLRESKQQFHSHAEFFAMMKASKKIGSWRLEDCDIYVTLEPCPMCAGAMIQSRVRKVYYGASDPKAGVTDSLANLFDIKFNHHVECEGNVLSKESETLLKTFFKSLRNNK